MDGRARYPGFDVMERAEEWDGHTREIVERRLRRRDLSALGPGEAGVLAAAAAALLDDEGTEVPEYVVAETDRRLAGGIGESQRQPDAPPEADLIRRGLAGLEHTAAGDYGRGFAELEAAHRREILGRVQRGAIPDEGPWSGLPQKQFFRRLLQLSVEAAYSHPRVWSEIGYAGPAYPRGYVRVELGLTDPWEASNK